MNLTKVLNEVELIIQLEWHCTLAIAASAPPATGQPYYRTLFGPLLHGNPTIRNDTRYLVLYV